MSELFYFQRALTCPPDYEVALSNHFCKAKVDPVAELAEFSEHLKPQEVLYMRSMPERLRSRCSGYVLDIREPTRRLYLLVYLRDPRVYGGYSFVFEFKMGNPTNIARNFFPDNYDYLTAYHTVHL